jgi:uncharacterized protein
MTSAPYDQSLLEAAARVLADMAAVPDEHTAGGLLRFQRCTQCGYHRFPTARFCPQCLSPEWGWERDSGLGSVWSFAVYHRSFHPAFDAAIPYNVALVELDSGPRLVTNVLAASPGQLRIGLPVLAVPRLVRPGRYVVYAEPREDEETS